MSETVSSEPPPPTSAPPGTFPDANPPRYAGFWIRLVAKIIDGMVVNIVGFGVNVLMGFWVLGRGVQVTQGSPSGALRTDVNSFVATLALNLFIKILYDLFFVGRFDATPGKMIFGLKLLRADGSKLGLLRIVARKFAEVLSLLLLGSGYFVAAWDRQKRALHDWICDTRVVHLS